MKRFNLFLIPILIGMMVFVGCGKNEKKTSLLTGTSVDSYQSSPMASAVVALFSASNDGATSGDTSYGAPRKVGTNMEGIGEANANGEYSFTDPKGMTIKIKFKKGSDVVYFNFENVFGSNFSGVYMYSSKSLTATKTLVSQGTTPPTPPVYVPAMFCKWTDNQPIAWLDILSANDLQNFETKFKTFIESNFPDSMVNTVSGNIPNGTIKLTLTTTMTKKPTDANPATMTGSGTITLNNGVVLTITSISIKVGDNGPIEGTQTFTTSTGESGTMTFKAGGSMDGTITKDGVVIATVHINADGTGTYTDVVTGQTYTITGAA